MGRSMIVLAEAVAIAGFLLMAASCNGPQQGGSESPRFLWHGDRGYLSLDGEKPFPVTVSGSEEAYSEWSAVVTSSADPYKKQSLIDQMLTEGRVWYVEDGTEVVVLDVSNSDSWTKIKIASGESEPLGSTHFGQIGWVPSAVVHRNPPPKKGK